MAKKLFVGNIDWGTNEEDLNTLFSEMGTVSEAIIIKDKFTNRSKGFGFVTYDNDAEADAAIAKYDGYELNGRPLAVNEARPREDR